MTHRMLQLQQRHRINGLLLCVHGSLPSCGGDERGATVNLRCEHHCCAASYLTRGGGTFRAKQVARATTHRLCWGCRPSTAKVPYFVKKSVTRRCGRARHRRFASNEHIDVYSKRGALLACPERHAHWPSKASELAQRRSSRRRHLQRRGRSSWASTSRTSCRSNPEDKEIDHHRRSSVLARTAPATAGH